jgi:hypothetical protein
MADILRIKRRASGAPGAPSSLANAEMAYNEVDHTLYIGEGTGGAGGSATVIVPIAGLGMGSSSSPLMDGAANAGSSSLYSKSDHVHPTDSSRAPLASPALTGTPTAPTVTPGTDNTTKIATTAFVQSAVAAVSSGVTNITVQDGLSGGGTGAVTVGINNNGIANGKLAQMSAHTFKGNNTGSAASPLDLTAAQVLTDIGAAPLASPTFTGVPAAPTAANGNNTTQLATTAYVLATRLDQFALPTSDISLNSRKITNLADPIGANDAANKQYVDGLAQGLDTKASVKAATTVNITLSGTQTVDGVALVANDRCLVKDQSTPATNGVYLVQAGAWTRSTDMDLWTEIPSAYVFVEQGTVNADTGWTCTSDQGGTLGTTAITWAQFSGAGSITAGAGLTKTGSSLDVIGTANRIIINADSIDIDSAYVGQTSITTLGTIATGTWNATTIAVNKGGTGATTLTGYVKGSGTNPFTAAATIPNTDITGLGTMSTQNANLVAITGGTIDGVILDGGVF